MSQVSGMKLTRAPCAIHLEREGQTDRLAPEGGDHVVVGDLEVVSAVLSDCIRCSGSF